MSRCALVLGSLVLAVVLSRTSGAAAASPATAPAARPGDGADLSVFLLTMAPGGAVYERFGHNALLIRDARAGTDTAYNYGMFSFDEENFILRFVQGRMIYWVTADDAGRMLGYYSAEGRGIWAQELNLTPAQRVALRDFLEANVRPENCRYPYDYYTSNCSTKVRDALDHVLGGRIRATLEPVATGRTYRDHTRRLMRHSPAIYLALHAVLGPYVDRPLSAWEECFLPMSLREHLRRVTVTDAAGREVPLVRRELELSAARPPYAEATVPDWRWAFAGVGTAAGLLLAGAALAARRGRLPRLSRVGFLVLAIPWTLVLGLSGMFGLYVLTTYHVSAHWNENLFHVSPLALPLALLLPLASWRPWARRGAVALAAAVVLSGLIGLAYSALPASVQVNAEIIALTLPINVGLAAGVVLLTRPRRAQQGDRPGA